MGKAGRGAYPRRVLQIPPRHELPSRLPPLLAGLVCFGVGIGMMVQADLGVPSWDVLHQGLSEQLGPSIGTFNVIVGAVLLVCFWPLGERIGLGTVMNVVVIGPVVDLFIALVDTPDALVGRWLLMLGGPVVVGIGSGLYIGAGLGPGPRDGLMTGIARRGHQIWRVRTAIEITVVVVGFAMGGTLGAGTVWFAISIGPLVQFFLGRLTFLPAIDDRGRARRVEDAPGATRRRRTGRRR